MKGFIYHVVIPNYWKQFEEQENYTTATFKEEGFIHCCTATQIEYVLTTYFKAEKQILLLKIDTALLTAELKVEPANGQHFPHIYGPINKNAISKVKEVLL